MFYSIELNFIYSHSNIDKFGFLYGPAMISVINTLNAKNLAPPTLLHFLLQIYVVFFNFKTKSYLCILFSLHLRLSFKFVIFSFVTIAQT